MSVLSADDLQLVADDIFAVAEAVLEHYRKLGRDVTAQKAPSPKYAKLEALWARRRNEQPPVVVNLAPDTIDVLDAVAVALIDIHAAVGRLPMPSHRHSTAPEAEAP